MWHGIASAQSDIKMSVYNEMELCPERLATKLEMGMRSDTMGFAVVYYVVTLGSLKP